MKKISKFLAVVLALSMVLALGVMAFASGEPSAEAGASTKQITINAGGKQGAAEVAFVDGKEYVDLEAIIALFGLDTGAVTWEAYQEYLYNAVAANAPDPQEVHDQIYALTSWADMDMTQRPWDQMFTTVGVSTWPEYVLAGGAGASSQVEGTAEGTVDIG